MEESKTIGRRTDQFLELQLREHGSVTSRKAVNLRVRRRYRIKYVLRRKINIFGLLMKGQRSSQMKDVVPTP